jgi:hypothetical protein
MAKLPFLTGFRFILVSAVMGCVAKVSGWFTWGNHFVSREYPPVDRDQPMMLPVDMRLWADKDHLAGSLLTSSGALVPWRCGAAASGPRLPPKGAIERTLCHPKAPSRETGKRETAGCGPVPAGHPGHAHLNPRQSASPIAHRPPGTSTDAKHEHRAREISRRIPGSVRRSRPSRSARRSRQGARPP